MRTLWKKLSSFRRLYLHIACLKTHCNTPSHSFPTRCLMRTSIALVLLLAAPIGRTHASEPVSAADKPRVKLAVLVVFDQMRGDYLEKWKPLFGTDGFARLQTDGAWFTKCYYPYGTTTTGPGHASMLSGTCGDKHGIVNNNWYEGGAVVYCAGSTRYEFVPAPTTKPDPKAKPKEIGCPDRMLAETVADVLARRTPEGQDLRTLAQGPLRDPAHRQAAGRRVLVHRQVRHLDVLRGPRSPLGRRVQQLEDRGQMVRQELGAGPQRRRLREVGGPDAVSARARASR